MGKIDISILNDLTAFDSATVQNAAIRIRGYVPENQDYSGTSLRRYTGEAPTIVGIATTIKATALNEPNSEPVPWKDYYEKISSLDYPFISLIEDNDKSIEPEESLLSPMPGTFYTAPTPDDPPFVSIGDKVKKGQVLCIIEAMKIMNEIESEYDGIVKDVMVNNGDPVEYNQSLFVINPT